MRLILANGAVYLLQMAGPQGLEQLLVFVPRYVLSRPWTLVTYMFLHGPLFHIFFNMLSLFFFGPRVESRLGGRRFLTLYFVSGIVGALLSLIFTPDAAIVGASGAVFGVMLAFASFWPRDQILIWGILPVEARVMVIAMTVMSLFSGFRGGGGIAHFAHLGGFLGGWLSLKWFERRSDGRKWQAKAAPARPRESSESSLARWRRIQRDGLHEVNRAELDRILDKISSQGMQSLTPGDREFLERFSTRETT
ncbi:MAG TPA: rhomboid family intramembrane serine protease [Gemmatimonadales bacterium]